MHFHRQTVKTQSRVCHFILTDMRKIITVIAVLLAAASGYAQDAQTAAAEAAKAIEDAANQPEEKAKPRYWNEKAQFQIGFNQTSLTNWAAGGYNTMTMAIGIDAQAYYAKDLLSWNNRLQLNYAFLYSADKHGILQKSNDRIYLESIAAYKTGSNSKWNYTASLDFRSQFTDTPEKYEQNEDESWKEVGLKSSLMSPAYINLALGLEWKPVDWFNVNIAPLTGGVVVVTKDILRKNYGLPLKDNNVPDVFNPALFQFGAQVKVNAKASLNDKFILETQFVAFTDYLNKPFVFNRINWDNKLTWMATKFFNISLSTWLIYDPIVIIDDTMSKVQFKEFLSLSFTYAISSKK